MYTNSSTAASLAPGWHTLGSTPIKITSLSRYTGEHQPVPVFLTCILSLPPYPLLPSGSRRKSPLQPGRAMEPQGVFVLSQPRLLGLNNVLQHSTICRLFAMVSYTENNEPPSNMLVHTTFHPGAFATVSHSPFHQCHSPESH